MKPVFVAMGAQDVFFCNRGGVPECEAKLANSRPDSSPSLAEHKFGIFATDNIGHVHLHWSGPQTYKAAYDILDVNL